MTANYHGVIYSGEWVCEGHSLRFTIKDNNTVKVTDTLIGSFETNSSSRLMTLDQAIEKQEKYIKLGYDKVS
jgi:hypothetical protein|tara:strand:+ start:824 stop:1039 length:216 start_codon:yes stop_codon:yes gene_type:complete